MKSRLFWMLPVVVTLACLALPASRSARSPRGLASVPGAAAATGVSGFVVPRDTAPRYSGPQGREADVTQVVMTGAQTGGAVGLIYQSIPPKGGPPAHLHRADDEFFFILSGDFNFRLGERIVSASSGAFVFVPRGEVHAFRNVGTGPGVLVAGVTPGGFEQFFVERPGANPDALQALVKKFGMEIVGPPLQ